MAVQAAAFYSHDQGDSLTELLAASPGCVSPFADLLQPTHFLYDQQKQAVNMLHCTLKTQ